MNFHKDKTMSNFKDLNIGDIVYVVPSGASEAKEAIIEQIKNTIFYLKFDGRVAIVNIEDLDNDKYVSRILSVFANQSVLHANVKNCN